MGRGPSRCCGGGGGVPPVGASSLHTGTRALALFLQGVSVGEQHAAAQSLRACWPDPLLTLQVQLGGEGAGAWSGEGQGSGDDIWSTCWLGSVPPGKGVVWPPPCGVAGSGSSRPPHAAQGGAGPTAAAHGQHSAMEIVPALATRSVSSGAAAALSSWQFDMWLGFGDAGDMLVQAAQRVAKRMTSIPREHSNTVNASKQAGNVPAAANNAVDAQWRELLACAEAGQLSGDVASILHTLHAAQNKTEKCAANAVNP